MPFPVTKRYFLRFRHSDTGLTPVFTYFNNAASFATITPPTINEVNGVGTGNGSYYFDYLYNTSTDASVVFEVDGGASIPTEEIRYISDNIGPGDEFLDEPVSQVITDVWGNNTTWASGTKGFELDSLPAAVAGVITSIQGAGGPTLASMAGAGFVSATDSLTAIATSSGLTPTQVANAVWDALLTSHTVSGSFGLLTGSTIAGELQRAVGMLHENSVLDLTSFDLNNNLLAGRLRLYTNPSDAAAAQAASPGPYTTNLVAQYAIAATYTGSNLTTYLVTRTA